MDCAKSKCSQMEKDCRCYAKVNVRDNTKTQFCGYKKNSLIIPCDPGCCDGGCPGECKGAAPAPPYGIDKSTFNVEKIPLYFKLVIFILAIFAIVSTLSA